MSGSVNRSQGIFAGILRIVEKLYIIFVDQIFKFLFQIPDCNGNIIYSGLMELADLAFDHTLSKYL